MAWRRSLRKLGAFALATALLVAAAIYVPTEARLRHSYAGAVVADPIEIPSDEATLERGFRLAHALTQCGFCHGDDLGGKEIADLPLFGRLWAPNLTSGQGGLGATYTTEDYVGALRHGVDRRGRPLALMPSDQLRALGDADVAAIIAYLRSVPPVDRAVPGRSFGAFTRFTMLTGLAPELLAAERIDHASAPAPPPPPEVSAEYGAYLVSVGMCRVCHHDGLQGGLHPLALPGEPVPSDLTGSGPLAGWSEAEFQTAMRTGRTPDGRRLDPTFMPWPRFAHLSDLEIGALWSYLRGLPATRGLRTEARVSRPGSS